MFKCLVIVELLASLAACTTSPDASGDAGPPDAPGSVAPDAAPFTSGVSTLAGAAEAGDVDGDRSVGRFANPTNVLRAPSGNVYVADFDNGQIRVVDPAGTTATLIHQADFSRPFGMALAPNGVLYVETDNAPGGAHSTTTGAIWKIEAGAHTAVAIGTNLGRPRGLAMLADGRLAMADHMHHVVEIFDPRTGKAVILAGKFDAPGYADATGASARFTSPYGVAVRADGRLLVTDYGNQRIRVVDPVSGATTTLAGTGVAGFADGELKAAQFNLPQGIAIDDDGTIYLTDTGNYRVRRIRGETVDTLAGDGVGGFKDADDRLTAQFWGLEGLAVARDGMTIYVADGSRGDASPYNRVRLIDMTP